MRLFFRLILMALFALGSNVALAGTQPVRVGTKIYYTGLLPQALKAPGSKYIQFSQAEIDELPDNYDSRTEDGNCVSAIRNQGSCGSCWAFSRTAALEAAKCRAGLTPNGLVDLSEQDTNVNDRSAYGCNGGFMGFNYERDHGVVLETKCPYRANGTACNSSPVDTKAISWMYLGDPNRGPSVDELRAGIKKYGMVSVTTAAGGSGYDTDSEGVFRGCGARGINHMTDFVAYRKMASGSYQFLMRNSWGTSWGNNGYGWMAQGCNQTGVGAESAAVVVVEGPGPAPAIKLSTPVEAIASKDAEVLLAVKPEAGVSYTWSYDNVVKTGERIWVKGVSGPVTVTGTKNGAKVSQVTNLIVE